jgi:adenosylcobinamide-GDP ribazoletransferase
VSFLTPFGGATTPSPAALEWFPVVGAAMGLALGGWWWLVDRAWSNAVSAGLVVAGDLALTGLLHLDGLADTADGLLPALPRERRLQAMTDPGVGAFGTGVVVVTLLLRFGAFVALRPSILLVGALWCASRTTMAVAARVVPYARAEGLATAFLSDAPGHSVDRIALVGVVIAGGLAGLGRQGVGVMAVLAEVAAAVGVVELARRRVGGFTGDVLGAAGMVGETVGLLVAAARW